LLWRPCHSQKHIFLLNFRVSSLYHPLVENPISDQTQAEKLDAMFKVFDKARAEVDEVCEQPQRNDTCPCGSGLKYKRCCLNEKLDDESPQKIRIEESII